MVSIVSVESDSQKDSQTSPSRSTSMQICSCGDADSPISSHDVGRISQSINAISRMESVHKCKPQSDYSCVVAHPDSALAAVLVRDALIQTLTTEHREAASILNEFQ